MQGKYSTGVETVDRMGQINFTGNVIPVRWFKAILRDNGRPYLLAICILSELCFWYRPKEVRDERSGFVTGYKKRFRGDLLQKDYKQLGDFFGESKNSVKAAMDKLEKMKLIRRVWRNITVKGCNFTNVLYIDINPDRIQEITFGDDPDGGDDEEDDETPQADESGTDEQCETSARIGQRLETEEKTITRFGQKLENKSEKVPETPVNMHIEKFLGRVPENYEGGHKFPGRAPENYEGSQKFPGRVPENFFDPVQKKSGTYTESTINITENTSYLISSKKRTDDGIESITAEDIDIVREEIKHRVGYDALAVDNRFHSYSLDELIEIMVEVYVTCADITIGGTVIPYQLMKRRLDMYDQFIMEYVLRSLEENHTKVGNVKKYLLATLYNAPATQYNRVYLELQEYE